MGSGSGTLYVTYLWSMDPGIMDHAKLGTDKIWVPIKVGTCVYGLNHHTSIRKTPTNATSLWQCSHEKVHIRIARCPPILVEQASALHQLP